MTKPTTRPGAKATQIDAGLIETHTAPANRLPTLRVFAARTNRLYLRNGAQQLIDGRHSRLFQLLPVQHDQLRPDRCRATNARAGHDQLIRYQFRHAKR